MIYAQAAEVVNIKKFAINEKMDKCAREISQDLIFFIVNKAIHGFKHCKIWKYKTMELWY